MTSIELLLPNQQFDDIKVYINQQLKGEKQNCDRIFVEFDHAMPVTIDVEFWPFKIKPLVRYDGFLLDYWLGNISLQDHKLTLTVTDTFFEDYRNKNIQGRINSLTAQQKNANHFFDQYIGVNNLYPDVINEIRKLIDS